MKHLDRRTNIALTAALIAGAMSPMPVFAKAAEPAFTTIVREGNFEIRDYQSQVVAEVSVRGEMSQAGNRGFNPLAGYIFGGNQPRAKIAMTAPVTRQQGARIAMTAPVTRQAVGSVWKVRFIMPAGSELATMPRPNDPNVRLSEEPARRYAVIKFSGLGSATDFAAKTAELTSTMNARRLVALGNPTFASYDPPWTLPFMRRNEVWLEITKP
jgi:hypothetical protein